MSEWSPTCRVSPVDHPRRVFSRFYARISERMEAEGLTPLRQELLADLAGAVVEVGAGNGMNFTHYPDTVTRVLARRARALPARAGHPGRQDSTGAGDRAGRHRRPAAAARCQRRRRRAVPGVVPLDDRPAALTGLRRVLRPGGVLRFLEHAIAETSGLRAVQRVADATMWPLLAGGCHTATNPAAAITGAGFEISTCRRLRFPPNRFTQPSSPHVLGSARVR